MTAILVGACSGQGASPSASPSAAPTPSGSPAASLSGIDHPTGPADVVLRLEEGGGFVPIDFLATQAPTFSLYGDGTVVFRESAIAFPGPGPDGVVVYPTFRTVRLDEDQVQDLLEFAIGPGGLGLARNGRYDYPNVADAGSSFFDLAAGGHDKRVEVYALGIEGPDVPDASARAAFLGLAEQLRHFDKADGLGAISYEPERYRGVLFENEVAPTGARAWPWPELAVTDFATGPDGLGLPRATMSPADIAILGIQGPTGGLSGVNLASPDGSKSYMFSARPLFPGDAS